MKYPSLIFLSAISLIGVAAAQNNLPVRQSGEDVNDPALRLRTGLQPNTNLLFNGWGVTPAGKSVMTTDLPLKLVVAPDHKYALSVHGGYNQQGVTVLDLATQSQCRFIPLPTTWNGLAFSADGRQFFVSGGSKGVIHVFNYAKGKATLLRSISPRSADEAFLAGMTMDPHTGKLYVCDEANDEIWVLDSKTLTLETTIPVGAHPYTCVIGGDGRHLYVSAWGNRSVSVVDMQAARRVRDISVGLRPNDMALAPDGRLFVTCAGDNTVYVIETGHLEAQDAPPDSTRRLPENAREIISTALYPDSPEGSTPDAVAVSPDGRTLFVANADNNDVMVVDISNSFADDKAKENGESVSTVEGFIPVGWYPSAVAVSPDGRTLLVGNGKGLMSHPNFPPADTDHMARLTSTLGRGPAKAGYDYIANTMHGSVAFIPLPKAPQLAAYTRQVRLNSPYQPAQFQTAPVPSNSIIPTQVGAPCPIKYVLYIIKENRTYDQVFGDFRDAQGNPAGNSDSNICMYGESITPNHHQLARDYVLLDNLYCNGEVSADGHSWCDAAIANDFNERHWLLSYSGHGLLAGNQEMEDPAAGYLWDLCHRHGVSFKCYGEGANRVPVSNRGTWGKGRDMDRVNGWIKDLHESEKTGVMPRFAIMSLGEDHTSGTSPGSFTPDAMVASNDIGLARIIEAASHSRFWKEMAIFVIEDDAQNGPDHVDAHRTAGLVISPWCKRGAIDSTLYTTASMVRTIELILGLEPLTQYDAGATPMFNCFGSTPLLTVYQPLTPKVDLFAKNTEQSPGAKQSARMDFREYDRAPEDELNRILWAAAKGPKAPYPTPIHRVLFTGAPAPTVE